MGSPMDDVPGGWATLISLIITTIGSATGYIWTSRETIFKKQIEHLEGELAACRLKIDTLQDKLLLQALAQSDAAKVQAETYQRLAKSLEEQNAALKSVTRVVPS